MNHKWEKDCKWEKVDPVKGEAGALFLCKDQGFNKQAGLITVIAVNVVSHSVSPKFETFYAKHYKSETRVTKN